MKPLEKQFIFDALIDEENLCNLDLEKKSILSTIEHGQKAVVYGRRNTGKTSLIRNVILTKLRKVGKPKFIVFADLLGVKNLEALSKRIQASFEDAFTHSFPSRSVFNRMVESLKYLRPRIDIDPINGPSLSVSVDKPSTPILKNIFMEIERIHKQSGALLVFDEFQDIHFVEEAEALLRGFFQDLPSSLPIVVLGSKKHLLSRIFAHPNAPFSNWGQDINFSAIPYEEYTKYINERLSLHKIRISEDVSHYLQDLLKRVPEPINMVCFNLIELMKNQGKAIEVEIRHIHEAIHYTIESRASRFEEFLRHFTDVEEKVLVQLAKAEPVSKPLGKEFVRLCPVSPKSISNVIQKFENEAVIYWTDNGYEHADPLLALYLKRFR